jgi:hypothetical protein
MSAKDILKIADKLNLPAEIKFGKVYYIDEFNVNSLSDAVDGMHRMIAASQALANFGLCFLNAYSTSEGAVGIIG